MSYFATALDNLLNRKGVKAADVSRASGLSNTTLSRMLNGQKGDVSREELEKLAPAITPKPEEQAELVMGHMKDHCFGPGSHLIEISIRGGHKVKEPSAPQKVKLPPKLEEAFEILREAVLNDEDIKNTIIGQANIYKRHTSRLG